MEHPAVQDAAVVGSPDQLRGEVRHSCPRQSAAADFYRATHTQCAVHAVRLLHSRVVSKRLNAHQASAAGQWIAFSYQSSKGVTLIMVPNTREVGNIDDF